MSGNLAPSEMVRVRSDVASERSPFLLYVVNDAAFFLSHRRNIAEAARERGYRVGLVAPNEKSLKDVQKLGFEVFPVALSRWGANPIRELRSLNSLRTLYRFLKPDIVHHVTIKPVLYGSLAARLAGVPAVVNAVPGLGHVFTAEGLWASLRRVLVEKLYGLAFARDSMRVIFQNEDDREFFVNRKIVDPNNAVLIQGAGVDVNRFLPAPEAAEPCSVLFSGRLLWKKGISEFVEASRYIRGLGIKARFLVAGSIVADNPGGVPESVIRSWEEEGLIEYLGCRSDMEKLLQEVHIVALPSFYGEGVPKALIEAAAAGRPIVTTDTAGCRSIVANGENGILVPPRDATALGDAIARLLTNSLLRTQMGLAGCNRVMVKGFSEEEVVARTCEVYENVLGAVGS